MMKKLIKTKQGNLTRKVKRKEKLHEQAREGWKKRRRTIHHLVG